MRKKKFSFQEYILFITVEELQEYIHNDRYKVTVYIQPCDEKIYLLEYALSSSIEDMIEKVKCFAYQYQNPQYWGVKQIQRIYPIWEAKRNAWHVKSMIQYHGTPCPPKPLDYIPIKIPAGWMIVLNSFVKNDMDLFSQIWRQEDIFLKIKNSFGYLVDCHDNTCILSELFEWERDIAVFCLECADYEIFAELQEYICKSLTGIVLHIHIYFNRKDGSAFFELLEKIFCFSLEEAQEQLSQFLWKYRNGLLKK